MISTFVFLSCNGLHDRKNSFGIYLVNISARMVFLRVGFLAERIFADFFEPQQNKGFYWKFQALKSKFQGLKFGDSIHHHSIPHLLPPDLSRISSLGFSPHFCGKKCPEKSSRKMPDEILQIFYNKNPRQSSAGGPGQYFVRCPL